MLKNSFALTKVLVKSLFDGSFYSSKRKNKKNNSNKNSKVIILLFAILFLFVAVPFFSMGFIYAQLLASQDQSLATPVWQLLLPMSMIIVFVMSIFSILSVFFFSMDNKILLPLPLKSYEILIARLITALIFVYYIEVIFITPLLLGFAFGFQLGIIQFINLTVIMLLIPVLPIALFAIIFTYLSRIINFSKFKDSYTYIVLAFSIVLAVGINLLVRQVPEGDMNPSDLQVLIDTIIATGNNFISFFPFMVPAINSLTNTNIFLQILNILIYIIINIAGVALCLLVCQKPYYKTLLESDNNGGSKKKKKDLSINEKETKTRSAFMANVWVDFKCTVRSSTFFSNTFLVVLIMPILMVVMFVIAFESEGGTEGFGMSQLLASVQNVSIQNSMVLLVVLMIILFFSSMNMTSSSAISRMGKSAEFMKQIPMKTIDIVHSRIFWGVALSFGLSVVLLIALVVLSIINIIDAILLLILSFFLFVLENYIDIYFDIRKPITDWDNEIRAVKNNLNMIWGMLITFAIMIFIAVVCALFNSFSFGGYLVYGILLIASVVGCYLFYRHYSKPASELFKNF